MYTRVFDSILDSSINVLSVPPSVRWLWVTMMLIADRNRTGVVDMPVERLAARAGLTVDQTHEGLAVLAAPDPQSSSDEEEGRRVVSIREGGHRGWRLVNWQKYRDIANEEHIREQTRQRVAKHRAKDGSGNAVVTLGTDSQRSIHASGDASPSASASTETLGELSLPDAAAAAYRPLASEWHAPGLTDKNLKRLRSKIETVSADLADECDGFTWAELMTRARGQPYIHQQIRSFDFEWFLKREYNGTRLNAKKVWNEQFARAGGRDEPRSTARRVPVSHSGAD